MRYSSPLHWCSSGLSELRYSLNQGSLNLMMDMRIAFTARFILVDNPTDYTKLRYHDTTFHKMKHKQIDIIEYLYSFTILFCFGLVVLPVRWGFARCLYTHIIFVTNMGHPITVNVSMKSNWRTCVNRAEQINNKSRQTQAVYIIL